MTPVGLCIESLRRERRITQVALSEKLGVTAGYLCSIESGRKVPSSNNFISQLAEHLNLDSSEYQTLLLANEQSKKTWRVPKTMNPDEYRLVSAVWDQLGTMSPEKIQALLMVLRMEQN